MGLGNASSTLAAVSTTGCGCGSASFSIGLMGTASTIVSLFSSRSAVTDQICSAFILGSGLARVIFSSFPSGKLT